MKVTDNALETYFKKNDRKFVLDERSDCLGSASCSDHSCDGGTRPPSTIELSLLTQGMDQAKLHMLIDRAFRRRSKNKREGENAADVPSPTAGGIRAKV